MTDQIAQQAAAATETLARLTADYQNSPEQRLARAERHVAGLGNDAVAQEAGRREVARLRAEVERNPTVAQPVYQTEAQRVSNAVEGVVDHNGFETTAGSQVPTAALNTAVGDLLRHGVEPEKVKSFLATGHVANNGEDRQTQIAAAQEWLARLMRNEGGLRDKLFAGDPETKKQFSMFSMYAPAVHERTEEYDRVAAGMPAW